MNYFNKFPLISYDGKTAVNLLARAGLPPKIRNDKNIFYSYTLSEEDRVDVLSQDYYDSPGYTWAIWHANDTIDPYYEMSLPGPDLFEHIAAKYGSLVDAQRKIAFYRVNWYGDQTKLTIDQFKDLTFRHKKYWSPFLDQYGSVAGYERSRSELSLNTNRIVRLTFSAAQPFKVGEKISVSSTTYGYCTYSDTSMATIHHITGDFESSSIIGQTITGDESGTTVSLDSSTAVASTDAWTDAIYWQAVTFFDYEMELNERKKDIKLINNMYTGQIENELRRAMKQT